MNFYCKSKFSHIATHLPLLVIFLFLSLRPQYGQSYKTISLDTTTTYQTMVGFGGSLAFYEGWVTSHPNKSGIYDALFGELSLDILRLRNAHGYDNVMIDRAAEFVQAAEVSLGRPISVLSTSWGPPGYLKSNNSRSDGGTLKYTVTDGVVEFGYADFAHWWNSSLDEYNAHGIYPDYISIQNEPDWSAPYESCRMDPKETITATDTIAGYNKALAAVYDTIQTREAVPGLLGPENIGIGYNSVENYSNEMDLSLVEGIAHHLYHGVPADQPYSSTNFKKVGDYHPEIPHFQTEYSLGDWWSLAGLIYMSLCQENVVAYLYWDLAWDGNGLVSLDFPWDQTRWSNSDGYTRTKDFYVFKQYSAFIHPGWERLSTTDPGENAVLSAFISPGKDSATMVVINRSESESLICNLHVPGYSINRADLYVTSANKNCAYEGDKTEELPEIPPLTIATISMGLSELADGNLVESITLTPSEDSITSRLDTVKIDAFVLPNNVSDRALFWEITTNSTLANVTQSGWLIANGTANGQVTVRATATDGSGIYAETIITLVNQVWVSSITLDTHPEIIDEKSGSIKFTANVSPDDAFNKVLLWEITQGSELASIDQEGLLQTNGTGDGTVIIMVSATDGSGVSLSVSIKITNQVEVTSLELTPSEATIDTLMGSQKFMAHIYPENASVKSVSWSITSGSSLAMVDPVGRVIAKGTADGDVTVRATSDADPLIFGDATVHVINQSDNTGSYMQENVRFWSNNNRVFFQIQGRDAARELSLYTVDGKLLLKHKIEPYTIRGEVVLPSNHGNLIIAVLEERDGSRKHFKIAVE
ncbi:MAG: Ig-like domain-containing protein [Bacteroidales bacterium]